MFHVWFVSWSMGVVVDVFTHVVGVVVLSLFVHLPLVGYGLVYCWCGWVGDG